MAAKALHTTAMKLLQKETERRRVIEAKADAELGSLRAELARATKAWAAELAAQDVVLSEARAKVRSASSAPTRPAADRSRSESPGQGPKQSGHGSAAAAGGGHASDQDDDVDEIFKCPITMAVMEDPVVAMDGYTYDRLQIEKWLQLRNTSPITNLPMRSSLVPNRQLRSQMRELNLTCSPI